MHAIVMTSRHEWRVVSLISRKLELASDEANLPGSTVRDNGLFYQGYRQRLGMRVSAEKRH